MDFFRIEKRVRLLQGNGYGTIFSIKFNKPFAPFVGKGHGAVYGNEEKVGFLLKQFGLEDHRVYNVQNFEKALFKTTSWDQVNKKIAAEQTKAKEYLDNALS